jgi:hypothetical protein
MTNEAMGATAATLACRHHWIIDTAQGPTSAGRCKLCGARREFFNNPEDAMLVKDETVAR